MRSVAFFLMICLITVPALAASEYMGSQVQLGGSGTQITRVTPTANATTAGPTGSLSVTTVPPGVTIYIDGTERGVSPLTLSGIPEGNHSIFLKMSGYDGLASQVSITAGQTTVYTRKLSSGGPAPGQLATWVQPTTKAKASPGFEALLCIGAIGAVFLAGMRRR